MVQDAGVTHFGAGPSYVAGQVRAAIVPCERYDLRSLESVTLAGSPVSPECMQWCYENVKRDLWVVSGSGGTDVCSGFVGGVVTRPVYAGEIQARLLGCAAHAYDDDGNAVVDAVGELVISEPMPSMPVRFWNDPHDERYLDAYFRHFPGVWRHGDFFRLNARGGCFVLGRSDATLNRHGVRIGTAEIYRSLSGLDEVEDALIVNLDLPGGRFFMPLFVKLRAGTSLDERVAARIRARLARDYSPRHVPDEIVQVAAIPYTLNGKKMELPVRKLLAGAPVETAANRHAMVDPAALDDFVAYARTRHSRNT
jgi:acetoacetyl-CoA synthetase